MLNKDNAKKRMSRLGHVYSVMYIASANVKKHTESIIRDCTYDRVYHRSRFVWNSMQRAVWEAIRWASPDL